MTEIKKLTWSNLHDLSAAFLKLAAFADHEGAPSLSNMEKIAGDDRSYLYAALVDSEMAGYALAFRFPYLWGAGDLAYLYDIEVTPAHQQKGIGKLLIETIRQELRAAGVSELWLGTATDNDPAQALFTSTGGIKSGVVFNDYTYYLND
jgi:ribosomal protein S18 acetylase RimI-like enzyme